MAQLAAHGRRQPEDGRLGVERRQRRRRRTLTRRAAVAAHRQRAQRSRQARTRRHLLRANRSKRKRTFPIKIVEPVSRTLRGRTVMRRSARATRSTWRWAEPGWWAVTRHVRLLTCRSARSSANAACRSKRRLLQTCWCAEYLFFSLFNPPLLLKLTTFVPTQSKWDFMITVSQTWGKLPQGVITHMWGNDHLYRVRSFYLVGHFTPGGNLPQVWETLKKLQVLLSSSWLDLDNKKVNGVPEKRAALDIRWPAARSSRR